MNELLTFSLSVFTGFFAIMNPVANTPIFLGLVEGYDERSKKQVAKKACITAFFIVIAFTLLGKYIFELFGITIPAFKITGGILIFYVGFEMLMSKKSSIHHTGDHSTDDSIAISPLAIPILAGPGTIVTAANFVTDGNISHIIILTMVFALMIMLTYITFTSAEKIVNKLGSGIITVIGKIMGLILAIMGTGMVTEGIKLSF